ncbi:cryptochrome/photolyase family protein [Methanoplanus endosymbiosus]|uniref:DNA photolyase family protein n=1 Tax=Methanoplanus endosymbiosus TaxID=33865 RepID=A0A9E7PNM4_9EURY|nr:deoxyribodipyrimidine photo-lyase [Methanoplanus endosymbiosus]UUX93604.1 DNA photolyase family protein [Methanoplanus endosymbiosus]
MVYEKSKFFIGDIYLPKPSHRLMGSKDYKISVHIFRRDLRLNDNTALLNALERSEEVIPVYIAEPELGVNNPHIPVIRHSFIIRSLNELDQELRDKGSRLFYFSEGTGRALKYLIREIGADAVFANRDYSPYAGIRDIKVTEILKSAGIPDYNLTPDLMLNDPDRILRKDGGTYSVFTPYFRRAEEYQVITPQRCRDDNFYRSNDTDSDRNKIPEDYIRKEDKYGEDIHKTDPESYHLRGGRGEALYLLEKLAELNDYSNTRNIPSVKGTTYLSAHLRFGTVSVREVYHAISGTQGYDSELLRQLYWRDFYTYIARHNPHIFSGPFHRKYETLPWNNDRKLFEKWCSGNTGFPIVDAGMRELNSTGYMHNRVRMITASFLVKDIHINWMWGERYFASKLLDYDPCVNNGNWQWSASTGSDSQPWFRIFNPWLQQKKYDPDCIYIKRWIPELSDISSEWIHNPNIMNKHEIEGYPRPVAEHREESQFSRKIFTEIRRKIS